MGAGHGGFGRPLSVKQELNRRACDATFRMGSRKRQTFKGWQSEHLNPATALRMLQKSMCLKD